MLGKIVARSLLELDLGRPQLVIKPLTKERLETALLGQNCGQEPFGAGFWHLDKR